MHSVYFYRILLSFNELRALKPMVLPYDERRYYQSHWMSCILNKENDVYIISKIKCACSIVSIDI